MICILYTSLFIYIVRALTINRFTNELVLFTIGLIKIN